MRTRIANFHTLPCCLPVETSCFLQHLKHMLLEHIQSPIAAAIHIITNNIQSEGRVLWISGVDGGNLCQRVTIAPAFVILVAHHRNKEVPDELTYKRGNRQTTQSTFISLFSLNLSTGYQEGSMEQQCISVYQRLWLVVGAGVVEHNDEIFC